MVCQHRSANFLRCPMALFNYDKYLQMLKLTVQAVYVTISTIKDDGRALLYNLKYFISYSHALEKCKNTWRENWGECRMLSGEMLPTVMVNWHASASRGKEAGHFHEGGGYTTLSVWIHVYIESWVCKFW